MRDPLERKAGAMSDKLRREAHGGADPYGDVIQLVRSRILGEDDVHAELITPYW